MNSARRSPPALARIAARQERKPPSHEPSNRASGSSSMSIIALSLPAVLRLAWSFASYNCAGRVSVTVFQHAVTRAPSMNAEGGSCGNTGLDDPPGPGGTRTSGGSNQT
jgi:hypothetical protein